MNWQSDHCTAWLMDAGPRAKAAANRLAVAPDAQRNAALTASACALRDTASDIIAANEADVAAFQGSSAFRDRLLLTADRLEAMASGLEAIATLPDPLARTLAEWTRP
ncbi:MAG: gamma-glutamyl-phosphate reductase, partial [Pseudomonadota bacterium]|nr:gamma-glutamyl-phosphate reductase [Pseudomonadota bacterium]